MNGKTIFVWMGVLGLVFCTLGCAPAGPETVPVSGTVTLDGNPVEGATVVFFQTDAPQPARGTTDASGKFVLMTFEAGDGALLGEHKVTVTKLDESAVAAAEPEGDTPQDTTDPMANAKHELPIQYSSPSTSGLTVTVEKGMEPVTLELTSK